MKNTRKIVFMSLLIAQSLVLYIVESYMPNPMTAMAPGAKLGLSNIITLISLNLLGFKDAIIILGIRILMASMFSGGMSSLLYSISGGILSLIIMNAVLRIGKDYFSLIGVSIAGAIFHNIGQLIMASIIIQNSNIFIYLPLLLLTSIPTGFFIGLTSEFLIKKVNFYTLN